MNTFFNLTFTNALKKFFALFLTGIVVSISYSASLTAHPDESDIPVPVSINALMVTLIDHSAHYIWDYAALEREISDDEWRTIEYYAIQLAGSGPLITLGGAGSMDNTWAETDSWVSYSRTMTNAAMLALDAAKNKDKALLASTGDVLVASCEGCHNAFKPGVPTEGIMHAPDYDYLYHLFERK
jgi:hypothetical protein